MKVFRLEYQDTKESAMSTEVMVTVSMVAIILTGCSVLFYSGNKQGSKGSLQEGLS